MPFFFSPHLLMAAPSVSAAAACGEELTRQGWARHPGLRVPVESVEPALMCVCACVCVCVCVCAQLSGSIIIFV